MDLRPARRLDVRDAERSNRRCRVSGRYKDACRKRFTSFPVEALNYLVLGAALVFGVLIGYQWGYDIGYQDRVSDEVGAQLLQRKYRQ